METLNIYPLKQKIEVSFKKNIKLGLSSCLLLFTSFYVVGQTYPGEHYVDPATITCAGVLPEINPIPKTTAANCSSTSSDYTNKYSKQSFYIPTANSPLITLKITLHVIQNSAGTSGPFLGATGLADLNSTAGALHDYKDRYSDPRVAGYSTGTFQCPLNYIFDSRINYEVTHIYVYNDDVMNLSSNDNNIMSYLNTQNPGVLNEGMPIILNSSSYGGAAGYTSSYLGAPYIHSFISSDFWSLTLHLQHEIAHAFGMYHTYQASCCPENIDCSSTDFLCDVFPINNTMCASGSNPCNTCYELSPNSSNNIMAGGATNWTSPLQMGRRIRNMHLLGTGIRKFAKEMTSSTIAPWLITNNETWDFDIQMYEDIIVKSGSTLTIKCKVGMANYGRIIVERGAKLVIDGGEIYAWGSNWGGIQVWGTSNQPQIIASTGLAPNHGIVDVINQGTIRDAVVGISTGKFFDNGDIDWGGYFGGIIRCNNANFINNWKGVAYYTYHNKHTLAPFNTINNIGYFFNTLFETNTILKGSNIGGNAYPDAFASLWNVEGVRFLGNTYRNTVTPQPAIDNRGNGITSFDASYTVDRYKSGCLAYSFPAGCIAWSTNNASTFTDLHYGIYSQNTSPLISVKAIDNDFVGCNRGVYTGGSLNTVFTKNRINVRSENSATGNNYLPYGIYAENSSAYDISNNTIFTTYASSYGLSNATGIVINSTNGDNTTIYRNTLNRMSVGSNVYGNNKGTGPGLGLKFKCNSYGQGSTGLNFIDINMGTNPWNNGTIDNMQGSTTNGANNLFGHTGSTLLKTDFSDHAYFSGTGPSSNPVGSFNYFYNSSAASTPTLYDPTLAPFNLTTPLNFATMCPASLYNIVIGPAGPKTLAYAKSVISANTTAITTLSAKIDGGNTQALLNTINSNISNGNLKNVMEQKSPYLSDAVLIAYFSKSSTPNGHLKDIHDKNKPVSAAVWQTILAKNLPNGIMHDLNEQQAKTQPSAMMVLNGQIADLNQQKGYIVDEVVRVLLDDTINGIDQAGIIELLKADNRLEAKCKLLSAYVALDKLTEATALIAQLKVENGTLDEFCKLQELIVLLKLQTNNIFSIKTNQPIKDAVDLMAACSDKTCNEAYKNAQALLGLVYNTRHYEYMSLPAVASTARLANTTTDETVIASDAKLFTLYPNPSSGNTTLYFKSDATYSTAVVTMFDITGKLVLTQTIDANVTTHTIQTQGFTSGLYLVNLVIDGKVIDKQKLIIE